MTDHGKLLILLCALIGGFVGLFTKTLEPTAAVGLITGIIGYVTGNGVLAVRNQVPSLALSPKDTALSLVSTTTPASNVEWSRRAVAYLTAHGESFATADLAISAYLAGDALSAGALELVTKVLNVVGAPLELPTKRVD